MVDPILICTDLDRTLIPNGDSPEPDDARPRFRKLVARPEVTLAYVSGRHKGLVEEAIADYTLPQADFVISDVGTTIYVVNEGRWDIWQEWHDEIAPDWGGLCHADLLDLFSDIGELDLQEAEKQNIFKLSYYVELSVDKGRLLSRMQERLVQQGVRASLVWSIDDPRQVGLLDVLPEGATKLHAIRFLMQKKRFSPARTVFSGDSGNDIPVLASDIRSTLVANASEAVREEALYMAELYGHLPSLYLARGTGPGHNGNYADGILEGIHHFIPDLAESC